MIKFFRKIRQNLLSENIPALSVRPNQLLSGRAGRYLIYAIGEIVLVVIGILIALGINNWNNDRLMKAQNLQYLVKLNSELTENIQRLNGPLINGNENWPGLKTSIDACDSLLRLTYRGLKESDISYIVSAPINSGGTKYSLNTSTYEELVNTGKLYSLGSDELISAIANYYKFYESEEEYNRLNADQSKEALLSMLHGFLRIKMDYNLNPEGFNLSDYDFYFQPSSAIYKEFQTGLHLMKIGQENNLNKVYELLSASENLKEYISKELDILD